MLKAAIKRLVSSSLRQKIRHAAGRTREELGFTLANRFGRPNVHDLRRPERMGVIYRQPSDMCVEDKLFLYALTRGLRPRSVLEVGSRWGGSALIFANAMEDNGGPGQIVGIDPEPSAFRASGRDLHGRFHLFEGYSPQALPAAAALLPGKIDLALIDGLHVYDAAKADLGGLRPYMAQGGYVLLHDAFHYGIDLAVEETLRANPGLLDCGITTRAADPGAVVAYQGFRMLRVQGGESGKDLISRAYTDKGLPAPLLNDSIKNWDVYYNKISRRQAQ
ncbi:MAG TPA: class I SAM-dependent methyltransferase [Caldimonas sp.]|jgi:cephalosporin hydroxylase|nr:class I SAM-dependent methyltransferase [Caldimonas sp.]HEX2540222.1 class I SAM-dependent methyltransferase [Caldimonas sp.]